MEDPKPRKRRGSDPDDLPFDPTWQSPHAVAMQKIRFGLAKNMRLYLDCPLAGCQRNRTCMKPERTPCFWKHLPAMREAGLAEEVRASVKRNLKEDRRRSRSAAPASGPVTKPPR